MKYSDCRPPTTSGNLFIYHTGNADLKKLDWFEVNNTFEALWCVTWNHDTNHHQHILLYLNTYYRYSKGTKSTRMMSVCRIAVRLPKFRVKLGFYAVPELRLAHSYRIWHTVLIGTTTSTQTLSLVTYWSLGGSFFTGCPHKRNLAVLLEYGVPPR